VTTARGRSEGDIVTQELSPGEHMLTFVTDIGVIGKGTARKVANNRPGQPANWPTGGLRWSVETPVKLTVVGPGEAAIPMASDPTLDPAGAIKFTAKAIRAEGRRTASRVEVELVSGGQPAVPISADLVLRNRRARIPAGSMVISSDGMRASGMAVDVGRHVASGHHDDRRPAPPQRRTRGADIWD
jgi:hypothetical protein